MKYQIVRRAVLMEDEGNPHALHSYDTEQEAKDWIAAQAGEYFRPSDYFIAPISEKEQT